MNPQDFEQGGRFQVGRVVQAKNASYEASRTEPPKRYTQSDLIDAMMAASRFAKSDRDRALLREIAGLGTSRTREAIITNLVDREFLTEGKPSRSRSRVELRPTEAAMTIIESLPEMLTDPATTAKSGAGVPDAWSQAKATPGAPALVFREPPQGGGQSGKGNRNPGH